MRFLLVSLCALILALGLACGGGPAPTPTPPPPTPTPTPTPMPTATPAPKVEAKEAPAALKGVQEAMGKAKSFRMKGQMTFTMVGTPIPGMPTGPQPYTGEFSDQNSHIAMGDYEFIEVNQVVYVKASKDAPWQKMPMAPPGTPAQESPSEQIGKLVDVVSAGTEPCPRGGLCQVLKAALPDEMGGKAQIRMWIGLADGLIYKYEASFISAEAKSELSIEIYDYNVPVTIQAPIP